MSNSPAPLKPRSQYLPEPHGGAADAVIENKGKEVARCSSALLSPRWWRHPDLSNTQLFRRFLKTPDEFDRMFSVVELD